LPPTPDRILLFCLLATPGGRENPVADGVAVTHQGIADLWMFVFLRPLTGESRCILPQSEHSERNQGSAVFEDVAAEPPNLPKVFIEITFG